MMTKSRTKTLVILMTGMLASLSMAGCDARISLMNEGDADQGLVIVLPGIDGRAEYNERACKAIAAGASGMAVELFDWTMPLCPLTNQRDEGRNRRMAGELADRILAYRVSRPDAAIFLIGHSGGTAIAVWAAEALPDGHQIDGVVMLASSLSPGYDLSKALGRTQGGIVNFRSELDSVLLGAGTTLFGTMDGRHTEAAGKVGFSVSESNRAAGAYEGFSEIRWNSAMAEKGNDGGHFGCLATKFVSSYVAPLVVTRQWDHDLIAAVREGKGKDPFLVLASE
jgi:pimeloyl-ACP methyl ester carboxylesterase